MHLGLAPGQQLLNVGVGIGAEHKQLQTGILPGGLAAGVDLSRTMLQITQERTGAPLCQAEARHLPFAAASFDRLFCAYVLDLMPSAELPDLLREFGRVLKPEGRMALVSLTEGINPASWAVIALWKTLYHLSPPLMGGCRPIHLAELVGQAGLNLLHSEIVVQWGVPSEILVVTLFYR